MKLLVLLVVGIILFLISKNYKTQEYKNIKLNKKEKFEGDLYTHEAGLLVALMAKVSKADGKVCELEAQLLKHTFTDIASHFLNSGEIREKLKNIYNKEKQSFENTIVICEQLLKVTKFDYTKRLQVMQYLINLAFIDKDFSKAEFLIIQDIANTLKIEKKDFNQIIDKFKMFYNTQKVNATITLEEAYKKLDVNENDDITIVKRNYRQLVKKYHPDIVTGQGHNKDIIEEATIKLQEINEAYELIKKTDRKNKE